MTLPQSECERIFAGESPLKVWREYRGLAQTDLRRDTGILVERINKIEQNLGRAITKLEAVKLGRVLDVAAVELMPHAAAYRCAGIDVDEDAVLAAYDK